VPVTADQLHLLQRLNGMNGYAGNVARGPVQTRSSSSIGLSSRDSTWDLIVARVTGLTSMQPVRQGIILETQQYGINWSAIPAGSLGQITSSYWNESGSQFSALDRTASHAAGIPDPMGIQKVAQQSGVHLDPRFALDPRQMTTGPDHNRLHKAMDIPVDPVDAPIDPTTGRISKWKTEEVDMEVTTDYEGKWTAEEDNELLHTPIDQPSGRRWTPDEDSELLRAVEKFSVTRWKTIATLIPGRTKKQCWNRWRYALDPSIEQMTKSTGTWLKEEDERLMAAVQKHNGKNWDTIAALVPSRTKRQCMDRWHKVLVISVC
jgi:hypothetical protein